MADEKITELGDAGALVSGNTMVVVQTGTTVKAPLSALTTFIGAQAKADAAQAAAESYADGVAAAAQAAATLAAAGYTDSEIGSLQTALQAYANAAATTAAELPANLVTAAAALAVALGVNAQRLTDVGDATGATDAIRAQRLESTVDVDISSGSGGTFNLTSTHLSYGHINLTGTLSGDVIVKFPTGLNRKIRVTRSTTGTALCRVEGYSSGFTYLLPGQHRDLYHGSDILRGEALRVLVYSALITLSGDTTAGSPVQHTLCKLPALTTVKQAKAIVTTAITGSTSSGSIGYTSTYDQLLKVRPIASIGDFIGNSTTNDTGTDFTDKQGAHLSSAQTLAFLHTLTAANCTAGAVRVTIVAEYEGE